MILVSVTVTDVAAQITALGAGALLRLERASAEAGPYAEFATVALDADVVVYDIWDPAGDEDTWYRHRFSEADDSNPTAYEDEFQAGEPTYASRTDLLATLRQAVTDTRVLDRMTTVLEEVTRDLTREVGYSALRQPTAGTEAVIFDGTGKRRLHVHGLAPRVGIVELTLVEIRYSTSSAWIALASTDWRLEGEPGSTGVLAGEPYFHVAITEASAYGAFPKGEDLVRLTGAFGWPAIAADWREATVAWGRQRLAADPALPGGPLGPDEYGQPTAPDRFPRAVYDLLQKETRRHGCST